MWVTPLLLLLAAAAFIWWDLPSGSSFILRLRLTSLASLTLVGVAIGASTVAFHAITQNRVVTPALIGFDALYVFIQTALTFGLGATASGLIWPPLMFFGNTLLMLILGGGLMWLMFRGGRSNLEFVLLVGIISGTVLRSLTSLLQNLIDPGEFQVLQARIFASFETVNRANLGVASLVVLLGCLLLWSWRRYLDVLALGRDNAISLGVDYRRWLIRVFVVVVALVAAATALVGPVTFFGLLVASLAYQLAPSDRHAYTLVLSGFFGALALVAGQFILGRLLGYNTVLAVVVEFIGGLFFLHLLLFRKGN
ncbi:hypothetical protein BK816_07895 [Boudabousia tangfeifanii]|uniref:Enterobactin ABC transporter permease n=2 Tax=Boudabousia tangfeifanii TaxID=1912795 RepID=A0A1D9MMN5_9ACTO|nr:hypothetical protein BK816_07895 [Boudabousia tangfeifanii]